jgi:hypothetical protein
MFIPLFLLFLSQRVVLPAVLREADIVLLAFFRAAAKQDDNGVAVFAEVQAVAGTEINAIFVNAGSDALGVGKIALLDSRQRDRYFGRRFSVEAIRPMGEWTASGSVEIFAHFDHGSW